MSVLNSVWEKAMRLVPRGSGALVCPERDSLCVPWILEPGSPVRVPLHHACPVQHSLHEHFQHYETETPRVKQCRRESELTFATTANTMGPKIISTFGVSMLPTSIKKSE
jgi:hypothetical protein